MPRKKLSQLAKIKNIYKRWSSSENDNAQNQPLADITARLQKTNVLNTRDSTTDKGKHFSDVPNYIIVDTESLSNLFTNNLCNICHSASLKLCIGQRNGFAFRMNVVCVNCDETQSETCSSKQLVDTELHQITNVSKYQFFNAPFDVNMRIVQSMLSLGLGYSALEKFCMHMNLNIMSSKTFNSYKAKVLNGHLVGSNQLLIDIRKDVREAYGSKNDKDIVDIGVSYDGSWLTRGHTSNIGIGCVIDLLTGFVIDYEVMSKRCGECEQTKFALGEDSAEFRIWYEGHQDVCSATHVGSSGAMEVNAAVKLWERSESIGFRYTTLLSDGDSKAFLELKERKVYGSEIEIKKEECINHVSKRLGTALRQTVKDWRVKGVTLGGKKHGSLKEDTIKKLTRYYTNAIRKNKGDVEAMKTAIYATLFHCISTDQKPQHKKCPSGKDSWCFYQSSLARGMKPGLHKDWVKTPINEEYLPKILPIYQRLASTELLSRCVRGLTQNSNEALHSMIWNKCSKENTASRGRVLIAVSSAISEFNVGTLKTLKTFQDANCLATSLSSEHLAYFTDYRRNYFRKKIKSANFKVAQQKIKLAKLRRLKIEKKLGVVYKPGGF